MGKPTIKLGVKFESSQEAGKKLESLVKQLEGANKGLKLDLGLDTASKSFKDFSAILEKIQKQMQGMKFNINTNGNPTASIKGVENAIDQLQNKLNSNKVKIDTSSMDLIQQKINSIKTDMPENEFKALKKEIENDIKSVVNLADAMGKLNEKSQIKRNKNNLKQEEAEAKAVNKVYEEKYALIQKMQSDLNKAKLNPKVDTKEIERLQQLLNKINTNTAEKEILELKNQINGLSQISNTAGGTFRTAFGQMAQLAGVFNIAYMGMNMLRNSFREGFEAVKQMDSAMTTLKITMDGTTTKGLNEMVARSQDMATAFNSTSNIVMEAVKTFANAKESIDSIFEKTSSAIILSNLTGLDIQSTVDTIQSAVKQFDALADGSAESSMKVADSMVDCCRL